MMLPPGLAFAALSGKAWEFVKQSTLPKYYFDFSKQLKSQGKNQTPYASPVSLILGLQEVLAKIKKTGLEKIYAHNRRLSAATKAAMAAMGLSLYSKDYPSAGLTAGGAPAGGGGQEGGRGLRERGVGT